MLLFHDHEGTLFCQCPWLLAIRAHHKAEEFLFNSKQSLELCTKFPLRQCFGGGFFFLNLEDLNDDF